MLGLLITFLERVLVLLYVTLHSSGLTVMGGKVTASASSLDLWVQLWDFSW